MRVQADNAATPAATTIERQLQQFAIQFVESQLKRLIA
jgi:hypothetical protein